jgi:hypothetical protein
MSILKSETSPALITQRLAFHRIHAGQKLSIFLYGIILRRVEEEDWQFTKTTLFEFATSMRALDPPPLFNRLHIKAGAIVGNFECFLLLVENEKNCSFFELSQCACLGELHEERFMVRAGSVTERGAHYGDTAWVVQHSLNIGARRGAIDSLGVDDFD